MTLENTLLADIIGQHPARKLGFEELYNGLQSMVKQRYIRITRSGPLELFTYTSNTVYDRQWNLFTLISRGLILNPQTKEIIATPFPKFFNYGEMEGEDHPELSEDCKVYEKLDGSLAIIFYHDHEWHCATKGSFTSHQAKWAKDWINKHPSTPKLERGHTYLFEIIFPENKIIVDYDFSGLVLLSAYDNEGFEYAHDYLIKFAEQNGFRFAKLYDFKDIKSLLAETKIIDKNSEGWIVRFSNGYRLKIKGEEYIRLHRLLSRITPLGVWDIMLSGDDIQALRMELPEELLKDFDILFDLISQDITLLLDEIRQSKDRLQSYDDKTLGLSLRNNVWPNGTPITEATRKFLFMSRKLNFDEEMKNSKSQIRDKIFKFIKPKGNILDGYTPTDAMNRFTDESL